MSGVSPTSRGLDHQTKRLLDGLKRTLEQGDGQSRDKSKRWIRAEDLSDPSVLKLISGFAPNLSSGGTGTGGAENNLTIPPVPTSLAVTGGFSHIHLIWGSPDSLYSNHGFTTVYRNTSDNIATATAVHQTIGFQFADVDVVRGVNYFYWIRFTSAADIQGPPNSSSGILGAISQDPAQVLELISGLIDTSDLETQIFDVDLFGIRSAGAQLLTFAVDTISNQVVMDGALIQDATITDAKIGSLAVDKVTGISSSFLLSNIGVGNITNAYIGNILQSTNYVTGVSGWNINKNGFVEIQNLYARGNITANHLDGATGTYSGTLTANAINAVNTINIADNAITVIEEIDSPSYTTIIANNGSQDGISAPNVFSFSINYSNFSLGQKVIFHELKLLLDAPHSGNSYRSGGLPTISVYLNNVLLKSYVATVIPIMGVGPDPNGGGGTVPVITGYNLEELNMENFTHPITSLGVNTYRFAFTGFLSIGGWGPLIKGPFRALFQGAKR